MKPAGGAGHGGKQYFGEKVRVEKKGGQGGVLEPPRVQRKVKAMCRHHAGRGCQYSEANCRFYHSKETMEKHKS